MARTYTTGNMVTEDDVRANIWIVIILFLVISIVWYSWTWISQWLTRRTTEGFQSSTQPFGNKLIQLSVGPTSSDDIIELPGKFKITGFKFSLKSGSTKTNDNKFFKIYIANDKNDIKTQANRMLILNANGKPEFELDTEYIDVSLFENTDGTGKYVGSCLLIEKAGLDFPPIGAVDVYGLAPYSLSKADYDKMPVVPNTSLYAEKVGTDNAEVFLNIREDKNYKIGYIDVVSSYDTTKSVGTFTDIPKAIEGFTTIDTGNINRIVVRYQNSYDASIFTVDGPYQLGFIMKKPAEKTVGNLRIYFDEPIIANRIRIEGICTACTTGAITSTGSKNPPVVNNITYSLPSITAYGTLAVARDEVNFKLQIQKFDQRGLVIEGEKCPNVGEMMNKQLQAQLICEALEYKDRERNKRIGYETDKVYLKKLGDQETQIKDLESQISELIKRKNIRIANSSGGTNIDELTSILNKAEAARKEAEEYMSNKAASKRGVNVKLNLDPQFTGIASKLASKNTPVA